MEEGFARRKGWRAAEVSAAGCLQLGRKCLLPGRAAGTAHTPALVVRLAQRCVPLLPASCSCRVCLHQFGAAPSRRVLSLPTQFWKEVVDGLAVAGGRACFKGAPLCTPHGPLTVAPDMPDGAGIH